MVDPIMWRHRVIIWMMQNWTDKKINQLSATLESFFISYEKYNFKRKSYDPGSLAAADQETRCA